MRNSPWLVFTYTVIIVLGLLIALPNALPQSVL
jgi:SecD/SecF fusion protein